MLHNIAFNFVAAYYDSYPLYDDNEINSVRSLSFDDEAQSGYGSVARTYERDPFASQLGSKGYETGGKYKKRKIGSGGLWQYKKQSPNPLTRNINFIFR